MNDFTNREIKIGDVVAFHSSGYKSLFKGFVYNIGEKMICVEYTPYAASPIVPVVYTKKHKVYPYQCIILESQDPVTLTKTKRII